MSRRKVILLVSTLAVVGLGVVYLVKGFQKAVWAHHLIHAESMVRGFEYNLHDENFEQAVRMAVVPESTDPMPMAHQLAGTAAVDEASRVTFGKPIFDHPLPSTGVLDHSRWIDKKVAVITIEDEFGRSVDLIAAGHGWLIDLRPFVDDALTLDDATVLHAELIDLAARIAAGEFATYDEALAAYEQTTTTRSLDDVPVTRPFA